MYAAVILVVAGIASHVLFFNRAEHHMYGAKYLTTFLGLFVLSTTILVKFAGDPLALALTRVTVLAISYLSGLYGSLLVYRIVLHPLKRFPGPVAARISSLWFSTQLGNADAHQQLLRLHEKYGDFVRIGSSDLSITHPKGVDAIYGFGSQCTRAPFYDITYPMISMQTIRQRALHDKRRRVWSHAFSDKALHGYESRMEVYRNQMIQQISDKDGGPTNITQAFTLYGYDVMGDLAFSKSFNMLRNSEEHWAIGVLRGFTKYFAYMLPTWLYRLLVALPKLSDDWKGFMNYCCVQLDERRTAWKLRNLLEYPY